jgi:hypothetical protein
MKRRTRLSPLPWVLSGAALFLGCEANPPPSPLDPAPSPQFPWVELTSGPLAAPLSTGDWSVEASLRNEGGKGEFRVLILAGHDTTRVTDALTIRSREEWGTEGARIGFFSAGPRQPSRMLVESRRGTADPWVESDRADVGG